jgi:iron complex transport system ATP-binding protein
MGRNGAGKSTVLDLIAGMRRPTTGMVVLDGRPLHAWTAAERARRVGHLPQTVQADLPFTVEQLVLMGRYPHADRWFESEADHRAAERAMATRSVCRSAIAVSTLSGGERKVLLAACPRRNRRSCCSTSRRRFSTSISSCTASACCATKLHRAAPAWR